MTKFDFFLLLSRVHVSPLPLSYIFLVPSFFLPFTLLVMPRIRTHDRTVSLHVRWDGKLKGQKKTRIKSQSKYNHNEKKTDWTVSCLIFYESKRIYYMASATHLKRAHSWVMHVLVENITRSPVSLFAPTGFPVCCVCHIYHIWCASTTHHKWHQLPFITTHSEKQCT